MGPPSGIHWHMNVGNKIDYIATDEARQKIPWVRMIDEQKCIGCKTCLSACPHIPHRPVFNVAMQKSTKCDLCANAPYFSKKGGPLGAQACVTVCPVGALKLVTKLPLQTDNRGYDLNIAPPPKPVVRQPTAAPRATPPPETAAPAKAK